MLQRDPRMIASRAMILALTGGIVVPGNPKAKPFRPCLQCGKLHGHNNSFCSAECNKLYKATKK